MPIQGARKLRKMGIKVNLVTLSTPAYNTHWKDAYGGGLDSEDQQVQKLALMLIIKSSMRKVML